MKPLIALAAGWIAFVAVDMIVYGGIHADVVAGALGALIGNVVG
jgi:uncharacterized membrane protein YeaQ/YmgE (transglycosylase-associated protein family)